MIRAVLFAIGGIVVLLWLTLRIRLLRNLVCWLMGLRRAARWRRLMIGEHDGVRIVDDSYRKDLQQGFLRGITQALRLVAQQDPRRYRRVRKHLGFIVHHELDGAAADFVRWPSACRVDFDRFQFDESSEAAAFQLAASLVHEATHGRLALRWGVAGGLPLETRLRLERICLLEETRFANRVDPRLGRVYQRTVFRSDRWRSWYEERDRRTEWQKFTGIVRRFLESQGASNQALHRMAAPPGRLGIRESSRGRHR
jgi:hypothetical protein